MLPCHAILRPMLGLCSALLLFIGACSSAPTTDGDATAFDRADTNNDGVVSPSEWDQASFRLFEEIDADGDGQLSSAELARGFEIFDFDDDGLIDGREAPIIIALGDADGDGQVDEKEFGAIDWAQLSIDINRDEKVSAEEFRNGRRRIYSNADLDRDRRLRRVEIDDAARFTLFRF
ncbi:MAG: hypothetical protein QNI93_02385 [Kiloniellales bacterium]|nr:hypothetical protein [Kiloniellales bacterium]